MFILTLKVPTCSKQTLVFCVTPRHIPYSLTLASVLPPLKEKFWRVASNLSVPKSNQFLNTHWHHTLTLKVSFPLLLSPHCHPCFPTSISIFFVSLANILCFFFLFLNILVSILKSKHAGQAVNLSYWEEVWFSLH